MLEKGILNRLILLGIKCQTAPTSHVRKINSRPGINIYAPSHYPNDIIIENGKNTEKSPEDMRRLAVSQSPVKDHQR